MTEQAISLVVVGGDQLFREGIFHLLQKGFGDRLNSISSVETIEQASRPPEQSLGILVLLEWRGDGPFQNAFKAYRERCPDTRIVVLTERAQTGELASVLDMKVDGYLSRNTGGASLVHALSLILLGGRIVSAELMRGVPDGQLASVEAVPTLPADLHFTPRQQGLLRYLAEGKSNKEIARQFGTSESTVKVQVRVLLYKLGVRNRTQAAIWAMNMPVGMIPQATHPGLQEKAVCADGRPRAVALSAVSLGRAHVRSAGHEDHKH